MKKLLLFGVALFSFAAAQAQCTDLIISEYLEGGGNNKALEIYNASSTPKSLANYRVIRWDNGSVTADMNPEGIMYLPTNITLAPYQAYVVALNYTDPAGSGQTAPIDLALQAASDTLLCDDCAPNTGLPRVMCFNGDDALSLQKNNGGTWTNIDIFGCIGERPQNSAGNYSPTAGWSDMAPYYSLPVGYTTTAFGPYFKRNWTLDHTLIRKSSVQIGVTANPAPETFNVTVQWDSLPQNTFSNLGTHDCSCNPVGLKKIESNNVVLNLFPNPATTTLQIQSSVATKTIVIYNALGQEAKKVNFDYNVNETVISVADLPKGNYTISIIDLKGNKTSKNFIVQ